MDAYLHRTETFIWQFLRKSRRYSPLILADAWENLDQFPLPTGEFLCIPSSRPLWPRLGARLLGTYAQVNYPDGLANLRSRDIAVCHAHNGFRAVVTQDFASALGKPLLVNFYGADVSSKPFLKRAASGYRRVFKSAHFLLVEGPAMHQRLVELGARPSLLNPLWYAGAFGLGLLAGRLGDRLSLGFVMETERQVESHLAGHLERLPAGDHASRAIVAQMKDDEARHAKDAAHAGAQELPMPIKAMMRASAKVMTTTARYI